ncbi:QRFP-like peptide receptor [Gigantopelta aegis]|uniref:QRFP-like peptide receptor n=1 Tax=Gigantopelta aegis TaxID=1735272 RepID=UPI001B8893D3|nr:QRFP-like peptide receptor [Gigantopelta aegis]
MSAGNFTFDLTMPKRSCVVGDPVITVNVDPKLFSLLNSPSAAPIFQSWEITLKIFFYVVAFLLDVVGNSIVILIIGLNRKMRTTTNLLILNLAVSDLLVGIFCMWVHVGNQITSEWPFGEFVCKFNTFVQVVVVTSSVLTLTVISVERFLAIVFPLKARWSPFHTAIIVTAIWFVSASVACPQLVVRSVFEYQWKDRNEVFCDEVWPRVYQDSACNTFQPTKLAYYIMGGVVMYFVPIVVMVTAYTIITVKLIRRRVPGSSISGTTNARDRTKRKVIRMLVAVLSVFVLCWTPQQVLLLWDTFSSSEKNAKYMSTVKYVALYVAYLNSALNPILYCGFNDNFRKGFSVALRRVCKSNRIAPDDTIDGPTRTIQPVNNNISRHLEPRRDVFITNNVS